MEKNKTIIKCICCSKNIESIQENIELGNEPQYMWHEGMVGRIDANYGSIFDSDVFIIGLCDTCIQNKLEEQSLIFLGNYLFKTGIFKNTKNFNNIESEE